ncbi:MAG: hypothetical protein M1814_005666 [Vezdaea aestivalis]|nr:MAG: hypothetical protein M1814_005666 [Vezdaea aestivalis]
MSVEEFGQRLLNEVKEESLEQTLTELRHISGISGANLNIPFLDRLLEVFLPETEVLQSTNLPDIANPETIRPQYHGLGRRRVIEVTGTGSSSGKTLLLYYIAAISILPQKLNDVSLGGKGAAVIVLDTDNRFDVRRFRDIMWNHAVTKLMEGAQISQKEASSYWEWLEKVLDEAMRHLHIFRPQSSASLLATLDTIPDYLLNSSDHSSSTRSLATVLLDSVSAFYWQDKASDEPSSPPGPSRPTLSPYMQTYTTLVSSLRGLQTRFGCTIVATNWGLIPLQSERGYDKLPQSYRPHLPPVWTNFCTLRLIICRERPPKFPHLHSFEEAMRDKAMWPRTGKPAVFTVWVDQRWGTERWTDSQKRRLQRVKGGGYAQFELRQGGELFVLNPCA